MRAERTPDGHIVITMREAGYQRLLAAADLHDMVHNYDPAFPSMVDARYMEEAHRGVHDLLEALRNLDSGIDFDAMLDALQSGKFNTDTKTEDGK